ncbi:MAG TPA: head maturation protease, ClpP-related [Caulobacterales bacterium]|nr:head maturation protease, ClpP-related [Caulobacterales bacterium]
MKNIRFSAKGKAGEVLLYGDIGASFWGDGITAKAFADELKTMGAVDTLDVRINSYGGDVFDGLAIHRQLIDHGAEVTTHIDGIAASIASVIAMAGNKIIMSESGQLMIHDAWTVAIGNAEELRAVADRVDTTSATMAELYAKRSGASADKIRDWMRAETWFNGKEAALVGLVDEVAENVAIAARAAPAWLALAHQAGRFKDTPAPAPKLVVDNGDRPLREAAQKKIDEMRARMTARQSSGRG